MNVNQERFEYTRALQMDGEVFRVREMIPYREKEQMAQDYVSSAVVFDEKLGLAFEGYNAELLRAFLILVHYTDLDVSQYDNPQGRYDVYDAIASHGLWKEIMEIVDEDMSDVDGIAAKLQRSAKANFERQHALSYKVGQVFESLLGTENLTETVAKAEGLNSALIDMLGALQKEKVAKPNLGGNMIQFSKKKD